MVDVCQVRTTYVLSDMSRVSRHTWTDSSPKKALRAVITYLTKPSQPYNDMAETVMSLREVQDLDI